MRDADRLRRIRRDEDDARARAAMSQQKRADVTTEMLISAYARHGTEAAYSLVVQGYDQKVVEAAVLRDVRRGVLEYGTTPWHYWPVT